jgi:hypothetical protein
MKDRAADDSVRLAFAREFDDAAEPGRFSGRDFQLARDESFITLLFERKRVTARRKLGEFEVPFDIAFRFALIFLVLSAGRADYHSFKSFSIPLFHPAFEDASLRFGLRARMNKQKSGQKRRADNCVSDLRIHETPWKTGKRITQTTLIFDFALASSAVPAGKKFPSL